MGSRRLVRGETMALQFGPLPNNINLGYVQYDTVSGAQLMYMGGPPGDILNWKMCGGMVTEQPDTASWGEKQRGARWYNSALGNFFGWNGTYIVQIG